MHSSSKYMQSQSVIIILFFLVAPRVGQTQSTGSGINFPSGFADSAGQMILNGSAQLSGSSVLLTGPAQYEAGTAWYATPMNVQAFT
ncbi:MAG: hypothetical protein JO300_02785, partial [Silvibacterium sp.]|nr:hypothetical protein [Silvibacterium sp.]